MLLNTPKFLSEGDEIRIVSTARFVERDFIEKAVAEIEGRGFKASLGKNLFERNDQFAGTDAQRISDLNEAVRDKKVRAILAARGGYGTARILNQFDNEALMSDPKWICGYSDITALHGHVHNNCLLQSMHSTMPVNFSTNSDASLNSLFDLLCARDVVLKAPHHRLNRIGESEGEMIGGNLSMIYSLLGSNAQINAEGKILFLEDLDEYLYHIDRMMLALDRAGMLENLAGLVVGGMSDMNDNQVPFGKTAEEIIADRVSRYEYPVAFSFPSGHVDDNQAWTHGKKRRLTVQNNQPSILS